jgi:hypothetical protein
MRSGENIIDSAVKLGLRKTKKSTGRLLDVVLNAIPHGLCGLPQRSERRKKGYPSILPGRT